ncbi:Carbohydrate esterase family 4 protein [Mycena kentingensis (nom. inval.)]|nr:Carbohydrate esterase family 4 protein [Mycena kentingensis (nom. inval.)]
MILPRATIFAACTAAVHALTLNTIETRAGAATFYSGCSVPNTVALTFDDGPYIYGPLLCDSAAKFGAKLTFFMNGANWACIYDDQYVQNILRILKDGHQIATHTWSHKDLTALSSADLLAEIQKPIDALEKIAGIRPVFMRPPYGNTNSTVADAAKTLGQTMIVWDFDSGDSTGATADQSKVEYDGLVNSSPPNALCLNHETSESTVKIVIPYAMEKLTAMGYKLVTVADCLGSLKPYLDGAKGPSPRDDSWKCW